jgi:hypothetical protein
MSVVCVCALKQRMPCTKKTNVGYRYHNRFKGVS